MYVLGIVLFAVGLLRVLEDDLVQEDAMDIDEKVLRILCRDWPRLQPASSHKFCSCLLRFAAHACNG